MSYRKITALTSNTNVGVKPVQPDFTAVRLYGTVDQWRFTPQGEQVFRLSIGNYPYVGFSDQDLVEAGTDQDEDVAWTFVSAGDNVYTIRPVSDLTVCWTVTTTFGNRLIRVKPVTSQTNQLFSYSEY